MTDFLNECLSLLRVQGYAQACNVIHYCPTQKVDLAFMLKAIPCLEQVDRSAGLRLLETVNADYLVVSFPTHSLGGKKKGMVANYEARVFELITGKNRAIRRLGFSSGTVVL